MLDCVRRGEPTDDTLATLKKRVINVSVAEKFHQLIQEVHVPICLFPTRKACKIFNDEMLNLNSSLHKISFRDLVDEMCTFKKWNKEAAAQLAKMNDDCNLTAGLEANLTLARVMLRQNIDTKKRSCEWSIRISSGYNCFKCKSKI